MTFFRDIKKTLQAITANRSIFLTMVLSVVLYSFFYPAAYHAERSDHLPIVIVDNEQSPLSEHIITSVQRSPNVAIYAVSDDFLYAKSLMQAGKVEAILYLPAHLSGGLRRHDASGIGLYVSSAYFLRTQGVMAGLITSLENTMQEELAPYLQISHAEPPVLVHKVPLFNPLSGYGSYIFPAVAPLIVHQTILLGLCMLIASYRKAGWRAGGSEFWAIVATALMIGCLSCFYLFGFVFWWHDYPRGGNFLGMLVAVPIFVLAVIGVALLLASFLDSLERAGQVLIVSSIPLFFLTGVPYPLPAMPQLVQYIAHLLPSTHGVQALVQLNQMGTPLSVVAGKLLYLMAVAMVCLALAYLRLKANPITAKHWQTAKHKV